MTETAQDSIPEIEKLRHSTAHLLAAAVLDIYPKAKVTIGPAIEDGFYYDIDFGEDKLNEEDLVNIEKRMHDLVRNWKSFERTEVTASEAKKLFKGNPYKQELIKELEDEGETITLYKSGDYIDLCRGGHVDDPYKKLEYFKLTGIAGAYWRGSEKNPMLTRIYGTVFPSKKELEDYLWKVEEAKKRDHRLISKQMELYTISENVGQGLILWLPNGYIIKEELENWAKKTEKEWGYKRVTTPNITKAGLYYTSGHLPYYKNDMYPPMKLDNGEEYYLKPMNCPHHHMIYQSKSRSYKELPLRLAEFGTCYRYEASGELFGLMRVRGFTQNDAHIYCTEEQAVEEFLQVMKLHEFFYKSLGIEKYHLELSLRDPKNTKKYHGDEAMWIKAEELMRKAVKKIDIPMVEKIGGAAFYGPKIDFIIHSSIGREFAISTNQIDLYMGERFGLKYVDNQGQEKTPVIIHRAPLGSDERFVGFLIEHYAGNFPTWLTPVQAKILPITERNLDYAKKVEKMLIDNGIRAEIDEKKSTLQGKIREAQLSKVAYMLILGDREEAAEKVAIRERSGKDLGAIPLDKFTKDLKEEIEKKTIK